MLRVTTHSDRRWNVMFAYAFLGLVLFIAIFNSLIARDRPLWGGPDTILNAEIDAVKEAHQDATWPIIPFSPSSLDNDNTNYAPPGSQQKNRFTHWMGTDLIGRDIAAGMVNGCRISVFVVLIAILISLLIGIPLGVMAGYFGDRYYRASGVQIAIFLLGLGLLGYTLNYWSGFDGMTKMVLLAFTGMVFWGSQKTNSLKTNFTIPFDLLIMRILEVITSLPALLILLALSAIWSGTSIYSIGIIIGLLLWPRITQLVRNESLRLRSGGFITNARALGLSQSRIITRHLVPNLLTPIIVTVAFSASAVILLESTLSFLGIGIALEEQTWGSILAEARRNFKAWWLALFPGMAIFLTILSLNIIGEDLMEKLDPRRRNKVS